jgi:anti-sigma regulatory factor (Ser/Thr protein kinase)
MRERKVFGPEHTSVPKARKFAAEVLQGFPTEFVETVQLMVSELATNSLVHGGTGFSLEIECRDEEVRVEVTDGGPGNPEMRSPAPTTPHGRGIQMVDVLSDHWGILRAQGETGKTVWFSLARPEAVTTS